MSEEVTSPRSAEGSGGPKNPFAAPRFAQASSAKQLSWWMWIVACSLAVIVYTMGMILADARGVAADSGPKVVVISGGFWLIVVACAGRAYLWQKAVLLSLACGLAIWLTVGVTATLAVPWLLDRSAGPGLFPFLGKIYLIGAIFVPVVALLAGLTRQRTSA